MSVKAQIKEYITSQPEPKRSEMQQLHDFALKTSPKCKLWFFDGTNEQGKIVANPTVGYGLHTMKYANGTTREYFKMGLLANATGISVHILGIDDKKYLAETFGKNLGKASVTGYCIKFKGLKDINIDVLEAAMKFALETSE